MESSVTTPILWSITEARGAEQFGKAGAEGRGFGDQADLSGSNWIMKRSGGLVETFWIVGVPDGI